MKKEIAQFIKESVEWLIAAQQGCCRYLLDDHLAIYVGWSGDDPDWGINAGIKVHTSDYMQTDYDWLNFPYYEGGDVLDMDLTVAYQDDIADGLTESMDCETLADILLRWYDEVKDLTLNDDGKILEEVA